jgi:tetratricopeptide (TPR) repeat protein
MKIWIRASIVPACVLAAGFACAPLAWSLPSDDLPVPSPPSASGTHAGPAPNAAAVKIYNAGVTLMKHADELDAKAAAAQGGERAHTEKSAQAAYRDAHAKFLEATQRDPSLPEAWNNLGYTARKIGLYEDAIVAYARALALRPNFPQALEYRGEAYLSLYRLDDAEQAYMDLFVNDRAVANDFLGVMKRWIAAHQGQSGAHAAAVADLAKWVAARSQIAAQTASLTRVGAAASWR